MTAVKRNFFEFFILIGSICYLVVLFTPGWIIYDGGNIGVITFDSTEIGWFAASSCMIYFSFVLLLLVSSFSTILLFVYYYTIHQKKPTNFSRDVKKSGYSYKQRPQFVFLSMISLMVTASTVIAVILTGVNLQTVNNIIGIDATLGYSAWISVGGALIYFISAGLALSIAFLDCR